MSTRVVEGKKPYTGGEAIDINEDKVISLKLRDENNLIIYDEGDDEIYVDLQLSNEIEPTDAFPVGVNTGRVIVDNGWDKTGTLISAKTTSGDNIQLLYADDGTLWIDNGTGTFKQIYFKGDVDDIVATLTEYIDAHDTVVSDTAPDDPYEGELWYDTVNDTLKVYNGSTWVATGGGGGGSGDVVGPSSATDGHLAVFDGATGKLIKDGGPVPTGGGDVQVSDQANNIFTTGMKIWGGTQSDYQSLTPDSNTAYLLLANQPTPPTPGGWTPGVNTLAYYQFNDDLTDSSGNGNDLSGTPYGYDTGVEGDALQNYTPGSAANLTANVAPLGGAFALAFWISLNNSQTLQRIFAFGNSSSTDMQFEFYNAFSGFQIYNNVNATRLAFPFTQPNIGDWHSFVITGDGVNQIEVYIDGTQVSPYANYSSTFWYPSNKNIMIGVYGNASYDNSIDELVIEDKYRSQTDVDAYLANYN